MRKKLKDLMQENQKLKLIFRSYCNKINLRMAEIFVDCLLARCSPCNVRTQAVQTSWHHRERVVCQVQIYQLADRRLLLTLRPRFGGGGGGRAADEHHLFLVVHGRLVQDLETGAPEALVLKIGFLQVFSSLVADGFPLGGRGFHGLDCGLGIGLEKRGKDDLDIG